jgi:hypothetical protein
VNSLHFVGHTYPHSTLRSVLHYFLVFSSGKHSLYSAENTFSIVSIPLTVQVFSQFFVFVLQRISMRKKQNTKWEKPEKEKRFCGAGIIGVCCQSAARSTSVGVYINIRIRSENGSNGHGLHLISLSSRRPRSTAEPRAILEREKENKTKRKKTPGTLESYSGSLLRVDSPQDRSFH